MSSLNDIFGRLTGRFRFTATHVAGGAVARQLPLGPLSGLRKLGRSFVRFAEELPRLKDGSGHLIAVSIIAGGWLYGSHLGGSAPALVSGTAATLGLKATDIIISGQVETSEQEVFNALAVGGSLLGFDAEAARARVLGLPWVKSVAIRKVYPGKLTVAIAEKRAMAVWQHNDRLTVVGKTGAPIAKFGISDLLSNRFSGLPHLVGEGAAEHSNEILPLAAQFPNIAQRVTAYQRIAQRRWDVELANGIRIKLPEYGAARALAHVADLDSENRLLEREVSVIDVRLRDRVTLRLQSAAAETRAELVSARLKAMKKADRKL